MLTGALHFLAHRHAAPAPAQWGKTRLSDRKVGESNGAEARKSKRARRKGGTRPTDVGRALRSVYDETLRENVPDDFLDLLGKLN